jgi:hypothetical protein
MPPPHPDDVGRLTRPPRSSELRPFEPVSIRIASGGLTAESNDLALSGQGPHPS